VRKNPNRTVDLTGGFALDDPRVQPLVMVIATHHEGSRATSRPRRGTWTYGHCAAMTVGPPTPAARRCQGRALAARPRAVLRTSGDEKEETKTLRGDTPRPAQHNDQRGRSPAADQRSNQRSKFRCLGASQVTRPAPRDNYLFPFLLSVLLCDR
jgi:hypothetical protein